LSTIPQTYPAVFVGIEILLFNGNKRDFPARACGSIRVVNAAELLDRITLEM